LNRPPLIKARWIWARHDLHPPYIRMPDSN
jgi:hypothetical protein